MGSNPTLSLCLLVVALNGCAASPNPAQIQQAYQNEGRLCTERLWLPDTVTSGDRRKAFEDKMVQLGVMRVVGHTASGRGAFYEPAPGHDGDVVYAWRAAAQEGAPASICFGNVRATRILNVGAWVNGRADVAFAYEVDLVPWARGLYGYLHLPHRGVASTVAMKVDSRIAPILFSAPDEPSMRNVTFPPSGRPWYPHGMPGQRRHRPLSV